MIVGDIGKDISTIITENGVALDISTATTKELIFKHADGTLKTFIAAFTGTGTDGGLKYTTIANTDFDKPGRWEIQWHIIIGTRNLRGGEGKAFVVGEKLE